MKKLYAFIYFLILSCSHMYSENLIWQWLTPLPSGNNYFSTYFTSAKTGYIVGVKGSILKTADSCSHFTYLTSGTSNLLKSVYFVNENTGFVAGYSGTILKTVNAGATWEVKNSNTKKNLNSIFFTDTNFGCAVGDSGIIVTTYDGGNTWTANQINTTNGFLSVFFTGLNTGYAVGEHSIMLKTTNKGLDWVIVPNTDIGNFYSVCFVGKDTGYIAGDGLIIKTYNAGATWLKQSVPANPKSIYFTDKNNGVIVGYYGKIFTTTDAGNTWVEQYSGIVGLPIDQLQSVFFADSKTGYSVGIHGRILRTKNGGKNWTEISKRLTFDFINSFSFINADTGFFIGGDGTFLKTINGCKSFEFLPKLTSVYVARKMTFLNDKIGYVLGRGGYVYKTTNGGLKWTTIYNAAGYNFSDFCFPDSSTGYVISDFFLAKTIDGGRNWTNLFGNFAEYQNLTSLYFVDKNTGYVVSYKKIYKTEDGGKTWSIYNINFEGNGILKNVYFIDADNGYIAGEKGTIIKTTDGGLTWKKLVSGTTSNLTQLNFIDHNTGFVIGESGVILKTSNGGETWFNYTDISTPDELSTIFFTDANTGYLSGAYGAILKTVNGTEKLYLSVNEKNINIGTQAKIEILSNCSWSLYCDQSWLKISSSSGFGKKVISLTSTELKNRSAKITISAKDLTSQTIVVNQSLVDRVFISKTIISCFPFTSPSRKYTWYSSGKYNDTIKHPGSIDTIFTFNLNIGAIIHDTINITACDFFLSPSKKFSWTKSGVYSDTLMNSSGCDSILIVNVTIKNKSYNTLNIRSYKSYKSPSGKYTWSKSGTYTDKLLNYSGCDSVITVNLSIYDAVYNTITETACTKYRSPSGRYIWVNTGIYNDTIKTISGIDSILIINLTITRFSTIVSKIGNTLIANKSNATYQWLRCHKSQKLFIENATGRSFTPQENGSYSVVLLVNGCSDTSECYNLNNVEIYNNSVLITQLYPNPSSGKFYLQLSKGIKDVQIKVIDLLGKKIDTSLENEGERLILDVKSKPGVYFLNITNGEKTLIFKIVKY